MSAPGSPARRGGGLPPAWPLLLCGLVVLVVIGILARAQNPPSQTDAAPPPSSPTAASPPNVAASEASRPTSAALTRTLETGGKHWQVVARTGTDVWAIDPSTGRALRTPIPALQSTGPVSFLAGPGWVMVRPLDRVDGYLIRGDRPAVALSGLLTAGPALPGPNAETVWVVATGTLDLVDLQGRRTGTSIPFGPSSAIGWPTSDGRGGVLALTDAGVGELSPDHTRVVPGVVLAIGAVGILTSACQAHAQTCATALLLPDGRTRAVAAGWPQNWEIEGPGIISADGRTAAVVVADQTNRVTGPRVWFIDLMDGTVRAVDLKVAGRSSADLSQSAVFTPDGRHLLALDDRGELRVVDVRTGGSTLLDPELPAMQQLAMQLGG